MRSLLDINVIIALLDEEHIFHERAHNWWRNDQPKAWASCPLTENGVVRIMTHPSFSKYSRHTPREVIDSLSDFVSKTDHEFWSDTLSVRDKTWLAAENLHTGSALTDLYLLALAVKHDARLVTFDTNISLAIVNKAKALNLLVI